MHHCAFEYDSFEDLMASFDRLRKAGIEPAFCLDHGLTISLYYKDPEGKFRRAAKRQFRRLGEVR